MAITKYREQYQIGRLKKKVKVVEYSAQFSNCSKRKCFVPFNGNGQHICRLWEVGKCPKEEI